MELDTSAQEGVSAWPKGIACIMSCRSGGVSWAPFASLNLGAFNGDVPEHVFANRQRFAMALQGAKPIFLKQVHGSEVLRLTHDIVNCLEQRLPEADAAVSCELGLACTVLVADCLPVLFAAPKGVAVGAAHAGWRGLAAGILEATLLQVCRLGACQPNQVQAWLGPCIGVHHFEVGPTVQEAFAWAPSDCFKGSPKPHHVYADLPALARWRLVQAGMLMQHIRGGYWCTYDDTERFFSYRRDGVTGRMAASIWRVP